MNLREAILDALADDGESIVQICEYIKYLGISHCTDEVVEVLNELFKESKIKIVYPDGYVLESLIGLGEISELWFEMTETGKEEWERI